MMIKAHLLQKCRSKQKGLAMLEAVAVLAVFIVIINFTVGLYGIIASSTLYSIAARNYAFETFRHRADLRYLRTTVTDRENCHVFGSEQAPYRFHMIDEPQTDELEPNASPSRITFTPQGAKSLGTTPEVHSAVYGSEKNGRITRGVSPVWIKVGYGICINPKGCLNSSN